MPYVLPRGVTFPGRGAFVLAFGSPSVLEICTAGSGLSDLETPEERVCTAKLAAGFERLVPKLAGIHKFGTVDEISEDGSGMDDMVGRLIEGMDEIANVSISAYGIGPDSYEVLVSALLRSFRDQGAKKVHLIRTRDNELFAEKVVSRGAIDFIAFPSGPGFWFGPTSYVAEAEAIRESGLERPAPRPEIALSPRLASLMVNLTGLKPGQTLLDPFCGSGTILMQGVQKRLRCLGIDGDRNRVREARRNLGWASSGARTYDVRVGDARELRDALNGGRVDGVATEPILLPGFRSNPDVEEAKAFMDEASADYAEALTSIVEAVRPGGKIVMTVPVLMAADGSEVAMKVDGRSLGLREFQPGLRSFRYPVRFSFESTRWVKRALYVFEFAG